MNQGDPKDARWWLEPEDEKHDAVLRVVRSIRQNQAHQKVADLLHASLYGNMPMLGFGLGTYAARAPITNMTSRLSLNVVRNMIGAVTSKIASKNKPKPTFLTEGGDYEKRTQAERLEKYVSGVLYESGFYAWLGRLFREACVWGTGSVKVYEDNGAVCVERVIKPECIVDDGEAMYGQPRNMFQRKYIDRLVLKSTWASGDDERSKKIAAALERPDARSRATDLDDQEWAYHTTADQVLVTEAWHLGEDKNTKGRHCIVIDGCTLLDEEWDGPFPFAFFRWAEPLQGFFGVGLAEELFGIQSEINKLLQQIQRGHHLITGHYLREAGSKVTAQQLNNDLAAIVTYAGTKPDYQVPNIIAPEVYNHLWQLYAKAFEISGISQLNATGQKPAGLDSGAAQRAYQDIQTERFLEVGQAWEEFVVEVSRQIVRRAQRIGGSHKVRAIDKSSIEVIDWSEIDLTEDDYVIRVYPTSLLPSTPAGKLAWAQDMMNSGVMPPEDVLDVVDFPDTEQYAKRRNAPRRLIERNISHMLKTGEFVSPEPFDNHQLALRIVNEAYHEARLDKVPEEKLELLRRYMADTKDLMGEQMPPPAPMVPPMDPLAAPPPAPMAGPAPPLPPGPPVPMAA